MENIYLFVGPSGSGKSSTAEILSDKFGLKILESYTTRPQRYDGEKGHIFVREEEFDKLENKCAYTVFDGNKYCATSSQVDNSDIYIIDPDGIKTFLSEYNGHKKPYIFYFKITPKEAKKRMLKRGDKEGDVDRRLVHDSKKFSGFIEYIKNNAINHMILEITNQSKETIATMIYILTREGVSNEKI